MFECELNLLALEKHVVICDAEAKYSMEKMKKDVVQHQEVISATKLPPSNLKQHRHQIIISTCIKYQF